MDSVELPGSSTCAYLGEDLQMRVLEVSPRRIRVNEQLVDGEDGACEDADIGSCCRACREHDPAGELIRRRQQRHFRLGDELISRRKAPSDDNTMASTFLDAHSPECTGRPGLRCNFVSMNSRNQRDPACESQF